MLNALNNIPLCNVDQTCSAGRAQLEQLAQGRNNGTLAAQPAVQGLQAAVQNLTTLLATTANSLRAAGGNTAGMSQKIARMQAAADQLADGSRRLADGVRTLVDQTKQMGSGMNQAADLLLSMKRDASQPSMAGMYIPPQVLTLGRLQERREDVHLARRAFGALPRRNEIRPVQHGGDGSGGIDSRHGARRAAEHLALGCVDIDGRNDRDVQHDSQLLRRRRSA